MTFEPLIAPMEARSVDAIPEGPDWQYEPKWDGFRCLVFRNGERIALQSKSGSPLTRSSPERVAATRSLKASTFVLDGEIVVPDGRQFSFDKLLQRIHPAKSRIEKLAQETPALLIAFDLLGNADGKTLMDAPLTARRAELEAFANTYLRQDTPIRLSPATTRL